MVLWLGRRSTPGRWPMAFEPGLIGYAALTSLALAVRKRGAVTPLRWMPPVRIAKVVGWFLLVISGITAALRFGPSVGPVVWVAQICIASLLLVLLMSWNERFAFALAGASLIGGSWLVLLHSS